MKFLRETIDKYTDYDWTTEQMIFDGGMRRNYIVFLRSTKIHREVCIWFLYVVFCKLYETWEIVCRWVVERYLRNLSIRVRHASWVWWVDIKFEVRSRKSSSFAGRSAVMNQAYVVASIRRESDHWHAEDGSSVQIDTSVLIFVYTHFLSYVRRSIFDISTRVHANKSRIICREVRREKLEDVRVSQVPTGNTSSFWRDKMNRTRS